MPSLAQTLTDLVRHEVHDFISLDEAWQLVNKQYCHNVRRLLWFSMYDFESDTLQDQQLSAFCTANARQATPNIRETEYDPRELAQGTQSEEATHFNRGDIFEEAELEER